MQVLKERIKRHDRYIQHFEYHLRDKLVQRIKEARSPTEVVLEEGTQTLPEPAPRSTPGPRKRLREPTVSPEVTAANKPAEKRPKTSKNAQEWAEVPFRKGPRKKKSKRAPGKPERPKRAHSEAVIIKPVEGVSYAAILKNLKSRVNPEELGVKVGGIRETRTKDLLVEIKCAAGDRGKLDSAFRDAVGESGSVRHLVPMVEVEILDVDPTVEEEEVTKAVRSCLWEEPSACVKVSLTRKPFRGTRKAFVRLEEASALTLLKATHIKIGWVSCRVRKKTELIQCYRCLGFGHMAAKCRGPDRSRCCWRCGEEGNVTASYSREPRCDLCIAREEKPRNDHIPGTMRCAAFRKAAPNRRPGEAAKKESKLAAEKRAEIRRIAPIDKALKFKANGVPGSLSVEETGEF